MKHLKWLAIFSILLLNIAACNNDDDEYEGINEVYLIATGEKTLTETDDKTIDIAVQLTRTLDEDVTLSFNFENKTTDESNILSFVKNPIVIKAGEKSDTLHIKSQKREILTQPTTFAITLDTVSNTDIILNEPLKLTVTPDPQFPALTEKQVILLKRYKEKGMDISPWIGIIPVEVKITYPGDSYLEAYAKAYEKTITGKTVITLSDYATESSPVIVMTGNAMGLEEYLYDMFRNETIWNDAFWMQYPHSQKVMSLVNLTKNSEETFNLSLDSLIFNTDKTIDFVSSYKAIDSYGDYITAVGFDFSYSAWDRMSKLIEDGNQDVKTYEDEGASLNPDKYINLSSISKDDWANNTWTKASSSFNSKTGIMKFIFVFDHYNAGGYVKVEVTYTSPRNAQ